MCKGLSHMKYISTIILILSVTACTMPVKQTDIDAATYTAKPTQQEAETQIRSYLDTVLKDPESLKLSCKSIKKGWARKYRDRDANFGWVTPCSVNAKNSYDGYTGATSYIFLFTTNGLKAINAKSFRNIEEHVGYLE